MTAQRFTAVLLLACCAASGAAAQTVYRCGADGRTYQNAPCANGREVDVSDPRTEEQRRAAREASAADARLASQLERDQRAREAAALKANRVTVVAVPAPAPSQRVVTHARYHGRGVRYFADGTPVPQVYYAPGSGRRHK